MPTQKELILEHLEAGGTLTQHEAKELYGIGRLAARIYDLREDGHPIEDRTVTVRNRHGEECRVSEYFLTVHPVIVRFGQLADGEVFYHSGVPWEKKGLFLAKRLGDDFGHGRLANFGENTVIKLEPEAEALS